MNKKQRHELFLRFREHNPNPTTELIYHSTFELLIAVMLSAQATDVSVNKATAKGVFPGANPVRLATRKIWVSTAIVG